MRQSNPISQTTVGPTEAELFGVEAAAERSPRIVRRAAGALTIGLLAFSLSACDLLDGGDGADDDDQQTSEPEDDAGEDTADDTGEDESSEEDSDESDDEATEEATEDSEDEPAEASTDEPTDDPTDEATDDETSEASGSDTFESSTESDSFGGSEDGDGGSSDQAEDYETDAPDPLSGSSGTSSADFRQSVQDALDEGDFEEGEVSGVEIYDAEMDNSVKVTKVIRNFPSPSNAWRLQNGGEAILLYVEPDVGGERYTSINKLFFLGPIGQEQRNSLLMDSEMEAAGLTPYDGYVDDDQPGWVAFVVDDQADEYNLGVVRPETEILGTDETLDQQAWEFSLRSE
ncbi:MAG: hypothetical protein Q4F53_06330 [Nesterenkonia sp.]|nr:hypothetical protein [Nesterenkonia sp.]